MIEPRHDFAGTYRICRLGFFLLALGLVPACLIDVLWLVGRFVDPRVLMLANDSGLVSLTATLTPWATLAGSTVLWGAWNNPSWQRRAGLLLTMCLVDVGSWFLDQGDPMMRGENAWFRLQLGTALGWAEFALLASLSGAFLAHLGVEPAEESSKSTRSLAATGAVVWLMLFCETANLQAGWPIQPNPRFTLHAQLLWMGNTMIHTICLIQVTTLVVSALSRGHREVRLADETEGPEARAEEERLGLFRDATLPDGPKPGGDQEPLL